MNIYHHAVVEVDDERLRDESSSRMEQSADDEGVFVDACAYHQVVQKGVAEFVVFRTPSEYLQGRRAEGLVAKEE